MMIELKSSSTFNGTYQLNLHSSLEPGVQVHSAEHCVFAPCIMHAILYGIDYAHHSDIGLVIQLNSFESYLNILVRLFWELFFQQ